MNKEPLPPHSVEAEQGVLGSMLIDPKVAISECVSLIGPDYFFIPAHQTIYTSLVDLWGKGEAIDLITFTQFLRDKYLLESLGGASFITSLFTFVPTAANLGYYLDILKEKYILRSIITAGTESVRRAYEEQDEVEGLLEECKNKFSEIDIATPHDRKSLPTLVQEKLDRMERSNAFTDVISTGLTWLDDNSPLRKKDMPVISGERKSGKTMLALSIARNVALGGSPVAFFSLESSSAEAVDRLLAGLSRIEMRKQESTAKLNDDELQRVTRAAATLSGLPLYLYDDILDLHHIIAEARRLKIQRKVELIILDYLQLVRTQIKKDRNREQEVAHISRSMRLLALELDIPIIVLSQLNEDGRSRESRAIEQDCTAMWNFAADSEEIGRHWIRVQFQRNGPPGKGAVTFLGAIGRIENYEDSRQ